MGIAAVILGLLGILLALLATFLFGTVGGVIAGALGVLAIVLGFLKRRRDQKGGIPAIVIGTLALILAFAMTSVWSGMFEIVHEQALKYKPDGLWAQVSEDANSGIMGLVSRMPKDDEATMQALVDEMNELSKLAEADKQD